MKSLIHIISKGILVISSLAAQGVGGQETAFSYQGQLMNNGQSATGNYDITFTLFAYSQYGFPVGPVLTNLDTSVSDGLFFTTLDFGSVFNGSNYWLEIAVRTNGNGTFTTLAPRQLVTSVPYAVFSANASSAVNAVTALTANTATSAASVPASGITGTISTANLSSNVALLTGNGTLPLSALPTNYVAPGTISWQSPSSTTVQAQPNIGYLITNSSAVTITLPTTPKIGDLVEVTGAGVGGWIITQNIGQTIAASFTPMSLSGDLARDWVSVASSSDGTKLAAGSVYSGIWTSADSGTNWAQTTAPTNEAWISVALSFDGTKLAAVGVGVSSGLGGIWTSSNSGTNWVLTSAATNAIWQDVVSSSDGTRLAAVLEHGIWTSSDAGTNWSLTSAPSHEIWNSIASSSDGTNLAAAGNEIWISTNSGSTWTEAYAPTNGWSSISSSSNGVRLAAVGYEEGIWTSSNSGMTWEQTTANAALYWGFISSSSDGTRLAVTESDGSTGGAIWISSDSGMTWGQSSAPTAADWGSIASSADGTRLVAVAGNVNGNLPPANGLWTFLNGIASTATAPASGSTTPGTGGFLQGNFGTVVKLVHAGRGQFIALYQTGSLFGH